MTHTRTDLLVAATSLVVITASVFYIWAQIVLTLIGE